MRGMGQLRAGSAFLGPGDERLCEWCHAPLPKGWRYLICDYCRRAALALIRLEGGAGDERAERVDARAASPSRPMGARG